ncbi:MAG TPA: YceD family protein [Burkholderiaceae bacterium]
MSALVIDGFAFGRAKDQREGDFEVANLKRLQQDCADNSGTLHWTVTGSTHNMGYPQLILAVTGTVQLMCQRCLTPFAFGIDSETVLLLAQDDASADELESIIDDDSIDVVVGTRTMNILDLIEDEALLALPQSPRHDVCPGNTLPGGDQDKKELPFSVLKGLKQ